MTDELDLARRQVAAAAGPERFRRQVLDFIDSHPDALHRTCVTGHLTASAALVSHDHSSVLLLLHRKLGRWLQPGGHADGDRDLAEVALREATEETGIVGLRVVGDAIDVDVHEIPAIGGDPAHAHLDVRFLVVAPESAVVQGNHESLDLRWVGLDDLDALEVDDSTRRLVGKALAPR